MRYEGSSSLGAAGRNGVEIVNLLKSGERSKQSLRATLKALRVIQNRPDRLSITHDPLKLAVDASFGITTKAYGNNSYHIISLTMIRACFHSCDLIHCFAVATI